ncbi:MAG: ribonuclease E activity regulator RraA [Terriglobia bacterium]
MKEQFSTSDLYDAFADRCGSCEVQFKRYGGRRQFSGRIRTVKCVNDNALIRGLFETAAAGEVLVVDGGASLSSALMGDMIAALGAKNGWSGAVILGAVRDVSALAQMDFGIKALGSNPRKSSKTGAGQVDGDLLLGGITFTAGHWLYSDDDGIIVSAEKLS